MPFIHKQLALAITLALGVASTQNAQARGDMEPDSEWLDRICHAPMKADSSNRPSQRQMTSTSRTRPRVATA